MIVSINSPYAPTDICEQVSSVSTVMGETRETTLHNKDRHPLLLSSLFHEARHAEQDYADQGDSDSACHKKSHSKCCLL